MTGCCVAPELLWGWRGAAAQRSGLGCTIAASTRLPIPARSRTTPATPGAWRVRNARIRVIRWSLESPAAGAHGKPASDFHGGRCRSGARSDDDLGWEPSESKREKTGSDSIRGEGGFQAKERADDPGGGSRKLRLEPEEEARGGEEDLEEYGTRLQKFDAAAAVTTAARSGDEVVVVVEQRRKKNMSESLEDAGENRRGDGDFTGYEGSTESRSSPFPLRNRTEQSRELGPSTRGSSPSSSTNRVYQPERTLRSESDSEARGLSDRDEQEAGNYEQMSGLKSGGNRASYGRIQTDGMVRTVAEAGRGRQTQKLQNFNDGREFARRRGLDETNDEEQELRRNPAQFDRGRDVDAGLIERNAMWSPREPPAFRSFSARAFSLEDREFKAWDETWSSDSRESVDRSGSQISAASTGGAGVKPKQLRAAKESPSRNSDSIRNYVKRSGGDLLERTSVIAKQVISLATARSLGFVSQLWVDLRTLKVVGVEVRPNLLSGDFEGILLDGFCKVGDVILIHDESSIVDEMNLFNCTDLVGSDLWTETGRYLGKVRDYNFSLEDGAVLSLEFDTFGIPLIPASVVTTYALMIDEVLEAQEDGLVVRKGAEMRVRKLTKGLFSSLSQPSPQRRRNAIGERQRKVPLLESRSSNERGAAANYPSNVRPQFREQGQDFQVLPTVRESPSESMRFGEQELSGRTNDSGYSRRASGGSTMTQGSITPKTDQDFRGLPSAGEPPSQSMRSGGQELSRSTFSGDRRRASGGAPMTRGSRGDQSPTTSSVSEYASQRESNGQVYQGRRREAQTKDSPDLSNSRQSQQADARTSPPPGMSGRGLPMAYGRDAPKRSGTE